ncbi:hypothetical protein BCR35DRAFT_329678 [Leucosporidium creatinivorum]|uniref:Uncharacterized protein n=1 Tax=Leucosporidium creatinivorum TaxID=106004 RepID=A0A1Y2FZX0_9BASI|nr:hypothetical protein BCR35DRAFT_329678 [Leucosporidium creatinivorum]
MDKEALQQPTSTTYNRPQQPADSPAAALPAETLLQIFEIANAAPRRLARVRLASGLTSSWTERQKRELE